MQLKIDIVIKLVYFAFLCLLWTRSLADVDLEAQGYPRDPSGGAGYDLLLRFVKAYG